MPDTLIAREAGDEICDFCSSPEIRWRFPCESFEYPAGPGFEKTGSHGDWAACQMCHNFIVSGDWDALADHTLETLLVKHPEFKMLTGDELQIVRRMMFQLHKRFKTHRMGDPLRIYGRA